MSKFRRRGGLRATTATFSCPVDDEALEKMALSEELPKSVVVFKARLRGLFGDALNRDSGRDGVESFALAERSERRPVGRRGVKLDCCDVFACCEKAFGGADCANAEDDVRRGGVKPKRLQGD